MTDDLHELLRVAAVPRPCVLVGARSIPRSACKPEEILNPPTSVRHPQLGRRSRNCGGQRIWTADQRALGGRRGCLGGQRISYARDSGVCIGWSCMSARARKCHAGQVNGEDAMTSHAGMAGRTYVVTGSASGIGAATAALLRQSGAKVIGCDLADADVHADLSSPAGRRSLVDQVSEYGAIDAVLAIAGGGKTGMLETNYFGAVATLEGLRPLLAQSPAPRAVAVSSTSSLAPADEHLMQACLEGDEAAAVAYLGANPSAGGATAGYGTAKRALNRWIRRTAPTAEWAGSGIALNVVASGVVDTPAAAWIFADASARKAVETAAPQPFGGFPGRPEWVAELICWLASENNRFVTGQIVFADGGSETVALGDHHWR
ncbi:SDR family oxidoreductase [Nocardia sp. NBC_01499]|uniref:SDR family oxidoreductase n=1 Tax=Nocardia sp. NBC_01499 TaxID=2903597 RepID=UPI003869C547